jgi:N-acetylglucosaminyl-diphospho-decaprenol L-rhamnosyltransferase
VDEPRQTATPGERSARPDDPSAPGGSATATQVDVAVVIVTHNSVGCIAKLLDSIPLALGGSTADVVVVDNESTDGTVDLIRARKDCHVVEGKNVGYAAGLNAGVRQTRSSVAVLLLNPDARLSPHSVARLLRALEAPGVGIVAPLIRNEDGSLFRSLRREPSIARALGLNFTGVPALAEYVTKPEEYELPHVVDWALGAALLFSRTCYDAVGGWDESYFLYSEETDFCLRARDLGYVTLYEPSAEVVHIGGASGRNDTTHVMQILNRVRLYARRHPTGLAYVYWAATIASESSWLLRGHPQSRAAVRALLKPRARPTQLGAAGRLLPR